ncbi:MAG: glucose-6-phosphate dehydrogenase [Acidimicrobiia bacterium]|nr:glucose-6-phosphate dehydrogenase [Acidimicrobiia bacterium]
MIDKLVLLGATGDLAGRYLLPALAELHAAGGLPGGFELAGAARDALDDDSFRQAAGAELAEHAADVPVAARDALVRSMRYRPVDLEDAESVARAVHGDGNGGRSDGGGRGGGRRPVAVYLALPSGLFAPTVRTLGTVGLAPGSRIALEKPFGEDLESARALNALLARAGEEAGEHVAFRVDHFLGMASVQNLLGLRLANRALAAAWNSEHIEQVEIVWEETLALEGRAAYYDRAGQLKDMVQNHLLQVLCLVAMEPPAALRARDLRDRKLDVLRAVRPMSPADAVARTRRARYTAGRIGDRQVPAYVDEDGVDPARATETCAEVALELDNERWAGTRFVVRTAKAMGRDRMEVVVRFRPVAGAPFASSPAPAPNELRVGLGELDDHVTLVLTGGAAGTPPRPAPLALTAPPPPCALPAYSRVLLDILGGESTLSVRGDEAEQAWRIVTPVLEAWADGSVPLQEYPAGSAGPPPPARRA